jgi:hypothetical protein
MDVGKRVYAGPFDADRLPVTENFKNFGTKRDAHLVTVATPDCFAIFGTHSILGDGRQIMSWMDLQLGHYAQVSRLDVDCWHYNVFHNRKRVLSANLEATELTFPDNPAIHAYWNGKLVYSGKERKFHPTEKQLEFIRNDIAVHSDGNDVWFTRRFTGEPIDKSQIKHYIYHRKNDKPNYFRFG